MKTTITFAVVLALLAVMPVCAWGQSKNKEAAAQTHEVKNIRGWTVMVDKQLLNDDPQLAKRSLESLNHRLYDVMRVVPAKAVRKMREVKIFLDLQHELKTMQYHPSAGWLKNNHYDVRMARAVHLPRAARLLDPNHEQVQPWAILHELTHAYHDQVLSFDHPRIIEAWEKSMATGGYDQVLHIKGHNTKHYAKTNHKEYFAELTEAYLGTNDFYPFVRAELEAHDKQAFDLLESIWGAKP